MRLKLVYILMVMLIAYSFLSALAQGDNYRLEWQRSLPGLSGTAVTPIVDGGYLALGEDASYNSTTREFYDARPVVAKVDDKSNVVWSKTVEYDGNGPQTRLSQVIEVNGGYILGGVLDADPYSGSQHFCLIKISNKGDIVWKTLGTFERYQSYFEASALTATNDGGCLLVGTFHESIPSIPFIVITKVYASGVLEYSKTLSSSNPIFPWLSGSVPWVTQSSDGDYLLLTNQGQSHPISPSTISLMKVNPNGNVQWTQSYGGSGTYYHTTGACVVVLSDGYLIGGTAAPESSWSGGLIIRTDLDGHPIWNRTYIFPNFVYSALNNTQGGFLLLGTNIDASDSKTSHIWLWQTNAAGEIQTKSDLITVNTEMLSEPSQLAPAGEDGVVFTASFFYQRSFEAGASTAASNRFWVAKASVSGNDVGPAGSGFQFSEVAVAGGITAVTVAAIVLLLRHRKNKLASFLPAVYRFY